MDTLLGLVPFIVILAICPLMMFVMMRTMHGGPTGHEGHAGQLDQDSRTETDTKLQALEAEVAMLRRRLATGAGDRTPATAEAKTQQPVEQA